MDNRVLFESEGEIGSITINNPAKHNAFDIEMIKSLNSILEKIEKSHLKVIILKGYGPSFCSGGDISWEKKVGDLSASEAKQEMRFLQKVFSKIERLPQIFIAVIQGYCVGGGNELAMACDIRVALPSAKFIHPETSLVTVAPLGGTKRLPRLVGLGRAKYILLTGDTIDAKTALSWGLVDFLIDEKEIKQFVDSLAQKIAGKSQKSLALTKESVNRDYLEDFNDEFELDSYISCSRSKENKDALKKFLEKKKK